MGKIITNSMQAREELLKGIDAVADAVKQTLGPQGRTVCIESTMGALPPRITKDGVTVAKSINLNNPQQELGAALVKSVANKAVELAGDGTTTATILAQAIAREANKVIAAGMKPMNLKKGIELATAKVLEQIKAVSRPVSTDEEIAQVGTISANGDREVGLKIAEAMKKVGKEGVITVEESRNADFEVDVVEGMRFDNGYLSPAFCNNQQKMIVELDNPWILLLEKKINDMKPLNDVLNSIIQSGRPLLIIAEDFEGSSLGSLIHNKLQGFPVCAVKAPMFGQFMREALEDIAILTQGKLWTPDMGVDLQHITADMLGAAKKVIVTREHTTIVDGSGDPIDIAARVDSLRHHISDKKKTHNVTVQEQRLAKLTGGIAVIRVGGNTEPEMKEKKDRVDDALAATRAAVEEGIVAGGGVTLFYATRALEDLLNSSELNTEQKAGIAIVRDALEAPTRQIAINAGMSSDIVIGKLELSDDYNYGLDANEMEFTDLFAKGIIDPTKVVRIALESASSVASVIVTTEVTIVEDEEAKHELVRTALLGRR